MKLTVTIESPDLDVVGDILHRIGRQVQEGFTSGFDRNETSSYAYEVDA